LDRLTVIRFGALGDLCICGWFLGALVRVRPELRLTLVTKRRFADLAAAFVGVDRVLDLDPASPGGLWSLSRVLPPNPLLDAHSVLRSRLLTLLGGRRPLARLEKETGARRRLIAGADTDRSGLENRSLLDRFCALGSACGIEPAALRAAAAPPLAERFGSGRSARIAVAPGARWPSKCWPANKYADLIDLMREADVPVWILLGPDEEADFDAGPIAAAAARHAGCEVLRRQSLLEVAARLAVCRRAVTNDSGLLHLAEAVGTPVTALFGPTVRAFGYAPLLTESRLLEVELDCRPCSRTGSRPCHRGDLACLERIDVATVAATLLPSPGGAS
jgi:heptosyltransferase-2